jgi:glycosyltransferase involved in cell wall biosynthesis
LAQRVQRIIAVSEFTRQRIIELLGVPAQKVVVIHNGVDAHFSPRKPEEILAARRAIGIESSPYLLCVGSLEPRKNLARLMEAWRAAQSMVPENVVLVVAGGGANPRVFGSALIQAIPPRVHFAGYVADEQLPALYSGALAVVYPSLYEGFGLPPLEAMACGVPVVTSMNTSLPEVVGEAAVLVDPESFESIKDGILRVVGSQELRDDLRQKGRARAAGFTWEHTARQTLELLLQQA